MTWQGLLPPASFFDFPVLPHAVECISAAPRCGAPMAAMTLRRALFLERRGRIERRVGSRRLVEALDGRRLAQVFHHLRLCAVGDIIFDLRLDLFEGRRRLGSACPRP